MTVMNVPISKDLEEFVRAQVRSGRFASESAVMEEALRLLIQQAERSQIGPSRSKAVMPVWAEAADAMQNVPDPELERLPADGAAQIDHYVYGLPKRES